MLIIWHREGGPNPVVFYGDRFNPVPVQIEIIGREGSDECNFSYEDRRRDPPAPPSVYTTSKSAGRYTHLHLNNSSRGGRHPRYKSRFPRRNDNDGE
jgi:hypothetical protein